MRKIIFAVLFIFVLSVAAYAVPYGKTLGVGEKVFEIIYSASLMQNSQTYGLPLRFGWGFAEGKELRLGTTFSDTAGTNSTSYILGIKWEVYDMEKNGIDMALAVPLSYAAQASAFSFSLLVDMSMPASWYTPYLVIGAGYTSSGAGSTTTFPVYFGANTTPWEFMDLYGHIGTTYEEGKSMPTVIEVGTEFKI
ncbi:MAG: hypothetical protein KKB81_03170 [Candidatus Margulisbacteria bacterium]|nr:hypothetical protein [Candidatus Margulisiibacteriota bacterium]MBU1022246.1 hypothetical protein [Candidatus Margulisiibacteriota bacterium]MBU1729315.1 hypothetical protein [Candidatus Margulisiibacteriota bacterium]MBU1955588.1 hypothetical protein [Candidatus Margulisiibacteriota bacterium]